MDNKDYIRHHILPKGIPVRKYKKQAITLSKKKKKPSKWPQFPVIFPVYSKVYSFSCEMIAERGYNDIISQNFRALKDPSTILPLTPHFPFKDKVIDNQRDLKVFQVHQAGSLIS